MFGDLSKEIASFFEELFRQEETWAILFIAGVAGAIAVPFIGVNALLQAILYFLSLTWWLWLFLLLFFGWRSLWLYWRNEVFKGKIEYALLELRVPRIMEKSPQAMEQVLATLNSFRNTPGNLKEKYWDGAVTRWYTLEMVSFGGEIHLFVRCPSNMVRVVEAAFFSYYPDMDILGAKDYMEILPKTLDEIEAKDMEFWGTEMILDKEDAYPIKSYKYFESEAEEKQFDPISTFLEVLGKVQKEEILSIQLLLEPGDPKWKDEWKDLVDELKQKKTAPAAPGEDAAPVMRSPGETDVLKAIEMNLSKPAIKTLIRFAYLAPKTTFYASLARGAIAAAFNQYSALNLNAFRSNRDVATSTDMWSKPYLFAKSRLRMRKRRLLFNFLRRDLPPQTGMGHFVASTPFSNTKKTKRFNLNLESVASLFHLPTGVVLTAPHLPRMESRKTGPPAGLPIYGGEEEIQKYTQ
ncbi:hypothetical protein M1432_02930 [Patescibacteria group bacterium]|nr:hypothetical protein [Patescibacteria group bacterium]